MQAIEPCEQTSISMSNCRVRCFGAEGALWSAGVRAGTLTLLALLVPKVQILTQVGEQAGVA